MQWRRASCSPNCIPLSPPFSCPYPSLMSVCTFRDLFTIQWYTQFFDIISLVPIRCSKHG